MSYTDTIATVRALSEGTLRLPTVLTVPAFERVCPPAPDQAQPMTPFQRAVREIGAVPGSPPVESKKRTSFAVYLSLFRSVTAGEFTTRDFAKFLTDETDWVGTDATASAFQYLLAQCDQVERVKPGTCSHPSVWQFKILPGFRVTSTDGVHCQSPAFQKVAGSALLSVAPGCVNVRTGQSSSQPLTINQGEK